jgi:alpha-tubulin suppressor-like RCC1 family protein
VRPAVYCWGQGTDGQLGNGTNTASPIAVPASALAQSPLAGVTAIRSNWYHTCAAVQQAASTFSIVCWGKTPGNGSAASNNIRTLVAPFANLSSVASFTGGFDDSCALVSRQGARGAAGGESNVYCWGNNRERQLGNTGPITFVPQIVFGLPQFL